MIVQFPDFYPDELVYSLLARYYVRSGSPSHAHVAGTLFMRNSTHLETRFVCPYNPDAFAMITRNQTMEDVVLKHTMFPYYARFAEKDRRDKAFLSLVQMETQRYELLLIPKKKERLRARLRFCPICAKEDREKYGETYWHREHQIIDIGICPKHHCRLISREVRKCTLTPAEELAQEDTPILSDNGIERKVADYIAEVFRADIDFSSDIDSGKFLLSCLEYTKYLSARGQRRNISLLLSDFTDFYNGLPNNTLTKMWQFERIFIGKIRNVYEICLLALFLGIPASDLTGMKLPDQTQTEKFDSRVLQLHRQGISCAAITEQTKASYNTVFAIIRKSR